MSTVFKERSPLSIATLLKEATEALQIISTSPRLEAELLMSYICGISRAQLIARSLTNLSQEKAILFSEVLQRRLQKEPLAYIRGYQEFWSLPLKVNRDTLIPRPDTEILVASVLENYSLDISLTLLEIGTGSGAVALALAKERPDFHIIATDISEKALQVAQENAVSLKLNSIEFRLGDCFEVLGPEERVDVIVSNPPYLSAHDTHLAQLFYEPPSALVGGNTGVEMLSYLIQHAYEYLKPNGKLFLEHGYDQDSSVHALFESSYKDISQHTDLASIIRVTHATRN